MAFQLIERNTVAVTIKGILNDATTGQPQPFDFVLHCQRMDVPALQAALANKERSVRDFLQSVAQGWAGVQGADGSTLPFSPEAFAQMLNLPGLEQLAFDAYLAQQGARAKN